MSETAGRAVQAAKTGNGLCWELTHVRCDENDALFASSVSGESIHDKGLFRSERNALFNSLFSFLVCGREPQSDIAGGTLNIRCYLYSDAGGDIGCEGLRACGRFQGFNAGCLLYYPAKRVT